MEENDNMTLPLEEADNNITVEPRFQRGTYRRQHPPPETTWSMSASRPGMYIGRLGDGCTCTKTASMSLLKEVIDNSIDEFKMRCR